MVIVLSYHKSNDPDEQLELQKNVVKLVKLSKDLTHTRGKGFSRSNLTYMRKLYLAFLKCETLSHKLTWSHYFELLKNETEE